MVKNKGFTLLEVMLVLLLVSLASVAVIGTLPSNSKDEAKQHASALWQRIQLLNEEAMLSGKDFGLRVDESKNQYFLQQMSIDGWQSITVNKIPKETDLPDDVSIELKLGGSAWQDDDRLFKPGSLFDEEMFAEFEEKKTLPPPQIFIVASGEVTPFTIAIYPKKDKTKQDAWHVVAKENGQILLLAPGELDEDA